jgi:hypothetical protein
MGRPSLGEAGLVILTVRVPKKVADYYRSQPVYAHLLREAVTKYAEKHKRKAKEANRPISL